MASAVANDANAANNNQYNTDSSVVISIIINGCDYDGVVDAREECDTGSDTEGCVRCKLQLGYDCTDDNTTIPQVCSEVCGNGIRTAGEECDGSDMGCEGCQISPGFNCIGFVGSSSYCWRVPGCGNSFVENDEECDNGNMTGCIDCTVDDGFTCDTSNPAVCQNCGNEVIEGTEQCDNGNMTGCIDCVIAPNFDCSGEPSVCNYQASCGNMILDLGEHCDLGES